MTKPKTLTTGWTNRNLFLRPALFKETQNIYTVVAIEANARGALKRRLTSRAFRPSLQVRLEPGGIRLAPPSGSPTWDSRIGSRPAPPSSLRRLEDCISAVLQQKRKQMQTLQRCLGTLDHMLSGQDTVSAQSPSVLQDGGKSPDRRLRPPPASSQSPASPHGCALPWAVWLHLRARSLAPLPCRK